MASAQSFAPAARLQTLFRACTESRNSFSDAPARVPFKVTAGLHHPLRCIRPLTYEPNAPAGTMNGFLNVFIAAALPQFAEKILVEENPRAFAFDDGGAWWRDRRITIDELTRMRKHVAISFGSCSFEEPLADLREIGWL